MVAAAPGASLEWHWNVFHEVAKLLRWLIYFKKALFNYQICREIA